MLTSHISITSPGKIVNTARHRSIVFLTGTRITPPAEKRWPRACDGDTRGPCPSDRLRATQIAPPFPPCLHGAELCRGRAQLRMSPTYSRSSSSVLPVSCSTPRIPRAPSPWPRQRHLHAAMRVHFALARCFDGKEDHVLELAHNPRLHAIGLRRWHAAERLQRQHHVAEMINRVVDVLADFHVTFSAAARAGVEGMREPQPVPTGAPGDAPYRPCGRMMR